jgi:hypothetical protein
MRIGIFNSYDKLNCDILPKGLKNIISYPDNIGNIVFLESIKRQVGAVNVDIIDFVKNTEKYESHFDILILSLANMISSDYKIDEEIISKLENTKIPICIFSIGIQAEKIDDISSIEISESAKRILDLSIKSGTTIGLRGNYSKEYLDKIGYTNSQVIGCPSLFYKKIIPVKKKYDNILINGTFNGDWSKNLEKLYKFSVKNGKSYLIQNEISILIDKYNISNETLDSWNIDIDRLSYLKSRGYDYKYYSNEFLKLSNLKSTDLTSNDLSSWLINNSIFFTDFDEWLNGVKNYDMSIGIRFHGSVMSTLSNTPTIILYPDVRVKEFVDYHLLPNMNFDDFDERMSPEEIYNSIDYNKYEKNYDLLKENYISFLQKNGLSFLI